MFAPYRIITSVPYGDGNKVRQWCRENIGKPYIDWETFPVFDPEQIGVKVRTEEHAALVTLKWT